MLLLAQNYVRLGSTPIIYISERKYKHEHFQSLGKTGSTLDFLTEFQRFFLTEPR